MTTSREYLAFVLGWGQMKDQIAVTVTPSTCLMSVMDCTLVFGTRRQGSIP
jgi:hypothetical protein